MENGERRIEEAGRLARIETNIEHLTMSVSENQRISSERDEKFFTRIAETEKDIVAIKSVAWTIKYLWGALGGVFVSVAAYVWNTK